MLEASTELAEDHPYLMAKGVRGHGLRAHGNCILVPMRDIDGTLWNVQKIGPDGTKRPLYGGRVGGCFQILGEPILEKLCIGEGFATCATIHEITGLPVVVGIDAGNLPKVARALREKYPSIKLVIAGDDDWKATRSDGTPENKGRIKANEAAQAVGGVVVFPEFGPDREDRQTDFNDMAAALGNDAVRALFKRILDAPQAKLLLSSAEFIAGFVPPDYAIDGLIQRRFCYSLTGKTGAGKTALLLVTTACKALGRALGWPLSPQYAMDRGRVLYMAGENPDDIRMRWIAMSQQYDFDINAIDVHFIDGVVKLSDTRARVQEELLKLPDDRGVSLIIVDTNSAFFEGSDENDKSKHSPRPSCSAASRPCQAPPTGLYWVICGRRSNFDNAIDYLRYAVGRGSEAPDMVAFQQSVDEGVARMNSALAGKAPGSRMPQRAVELCRAGEHCLQPHGTKALIGGSYENLGGERYHPGCYQAMLRKLELAKRQAPLVPGDKGVRSPVSPVSPGIPWGDRRGGSRFAPR